MFIVPILLTVVTFILYMFVRDAYYDREIAEKLATIVIATVWITYFVTMIVDVLGSAFGWWSVTLHF